MNKLRKGALMCALGAITLTQTSCMGSFKLITGLYSWNETATDSKFVNQLLFWALGGIGVYGLAGFVDLFILNLVEFWTGSNPIAMAPGEVEEQKIMKNNVEYTLRATQNKFEILGPNDAQNLTMIYTPDNQTWNIERDGVLQPVAQNLENNKVKMFFPNGESVVYTNSQDGFAMMQGAVSNYDNLALK